MANKDLPCGAVPKGEPIRINKYVASAIIYPGDFVAQEAAGRVAPGVAGAALCGVALSYASAAGQPVMVADAPDQLFVCQADDATIDAQTDIGLNYSILATAGSSAYKVSRHEVDASSQNTTATLELKLVGIEERVGDAFGDNVKCVVRINNHQFSTGTGTLGV